MCIHICNVKTKERIRYEGFKCHRFDVIVIAMT